MSQISAADNLLIDIEPHRWRLFKNAESENGLIIDATRGEPLRLDGQFSRLRRLPPEGLLPLSDVQRVVLGWSGKDESWHLGLVLEPQLAAQRGSRWCEIAHWPDPDTTVFVDLATEAGRSLASIVGRSFNLIPPRPQPAPAAPAPPAPLPDLPLRMGIWTLSWGENNTHIPPEARALIFRRASSWAFSRVTRIIWYGLWVVVYIILSIATLTRTLALPNSGTMLPTPELLPVLGLAAALILLGMIAYLLYELVSKPDHIIVDPRSRLVVALRGEGERWRVAAGDVYSVYVTQVVGKKGGKPVVQHGELNLHLGVEDFQRILEDDSAEAPDRPWKANVPLDQDIITPLNGDIVNTNLQAAGLYVARALGNLPCWYDQRVR